MSCFDNSEEAKTNKQLNKKLIKLDYEDKQEIKLLLLGAGGCGKCKY
jgi:predicted GTPase